ncbi:MAG: DUF1993 domain-containing protein [Aquincola sp.]|nr:DUF1993 domain-containing protein [Aquincola sp.]MDH4287390.1 DUF1993 domain-containing protein [Aquincola sp.]
MPISMHTASAPVFVRMFTNLLVWLDKAEAHATARKFDSANYLSLRLAPDMLPFTRQIQIASDAAKACMARLAGIDVPSWEDKEANFADLRARVHKTIDYVGAFSATQIDGSEGRKITIPRRAGDPLQMDGETFLKHYALPNFFFHLTTAYALLRHAGVDLGKSDYLGNR